MTPKYLTLEQIISQMNFYITKMKTTLKHQFLLERQVSIRRAWIHRKSKLEWASKFQWKIFTKIQGIVYINWVPKVKLLTNSITLKCYYFSWTSQKISTCFIHSCGKISCEFFIRTIAPSHSECPEDVSDKTFPLFTRSCPTFFPRSNAFKGTRFKTAEGVKEKVNRSHEHTSRKWCTALL